MTAVEVALHLHAPRRALAAGGRGGEFEDIGGGFLTIDPSSNTPFPSTNRNRAEFIGVTGPATRSDVKEIVDRYAEAGVKRWFFRLSPCRQAGEIRHWLIESELRTFDGPRYITLVRGVEAVAPQRTALRVRALGAPELRERSGFLSELYEEFAGNHLGTIGREDCLHYVAFDGDRPVAAASLCMAGAVAYLFMAATRPQDRSRGAQNALIAARLAAAHAGGCRIAVAETLSILKPSLANLVRQGFTESHDTEVFCQSRARSGSQDR